jgi:hypothetical protein
MKNDVIDSVLGFDFNITIKDNEEKEVKTGAKSTYYPDEIVVIQHRIPDKKWFTHYNEGLLEKIIDYRRQND